MRSYYGWESNYKCPLTSAQTAACARLRTALESNTSDSTIQALVHSLAFHLFSHSATQWSDDKYFSPVNRALVLLSRREEGSWHPAGVITQIIAALVYCIRSTMLYQIHLQARSQRKRVME